MLGKPADGIRIVKRPKKGHDGAHGGAWKVAYADFVTAMMAFFLVMWIVGLNDPIKQAIAGYFKDPVGFMQATQGGTKPFDVSNSGILSSPEMKPQVGQAELDAKRQRANEERKRFQQAKAAVDKVVAGNPEFKNIAHSVQVTIAADGLRIDLVESSSDVFFDSGSATMKPRTKLLLTRVSSELARLPNKVIIEGHTDCRPYSGPNGWTNWELSTARGNAARSVMESSGLRANQVVEIRGLADKMPIDPVHRDSFRNRRVSILLPFEEKIAYSTDEPASMSSFNAGSGEESIKPQ